MAEVNAVAADNVCSKTIYLKNYQPSAFLIDRVDLTFELSSTQTVVTSVMQVKRNPNYLGERVPLVLNGEQLALVSIKIDGNLLSENEYQLINENLSIPFELDKAQVEIVVHINPKENKALSGLYYTRETFCTQCEAEGFRRITYYLDRPDVLARYTTTIIADKQQYPYLLSNGNLLEQRELPDGKHLARWEDPFKKPSYLFALVAGDFDVVEDTFVTMSNRTVALKIYVEKNYGDQAHHALYSVKEAMKWDEKTFGREYDLDVYMIVATHDFNMGAMENKGLNIFNTKYILAKPETATDIDYINILSVIGHEYFHNWSGNRVTCRDWFQLSLKEGLTIFRDQLFSQDLISPAVMRIRDVRDLRESQFPEDAGPLAHPVRPDSYIEINNFYTATVYNKGAEVLRMMQTLLGKDLFRQGLDLYFEQYDGQAVTIEEFVLSMEAVSGFDLSQFRLWYEQAGTPLVTVKEEYDAVKQTYQLHVVQDAPKLVNQSVVAKSFHIPMRMALLDQEGKPYLLDCQDGDVSQEKVLSLTAQAHSFTFHNINQKPVASLFRGFSAPIKVCSMLSAQDLLFLFKYDQDAFNRYESGQAYILHLFFKLIADFRADRQLVLPKELGEAWQFVLAQSEQDPFLISELLQLPSQRYIAEQMQVVDVDAIHAVREFLTEQLAEALQVDWLKIYKQHEAKLQGVMAFSITHIGSRQLKNVCLHYLSKLPKHITLAQTQFDQALRHNMTDTQSALQCLVNNNEDLAVPALAAFYEAYQDDELVIGKWLSIQATAKYPDTLSKVKALCQHQAFDLKNPNKVYALIGCFSNANAINFHAADGAGYAFLADIVCQLDQFNPQIAARMVKPLTAWRRYDKDRQGKMRQALTQILNTKSISNDVYELASKSVH